MESLDILITGVETSIALAGFSGIIATFQFAGAREPGRVDAVGLTVILQLSLLAALSASIPLLLYTFGVKETTLWAISSVFPVITYAGGLYVIARHMRGVFRSKSFGTLIVIVHCLCFGFTVINVMNASDIFFHREAGPVIAFIVWTLSFAGYMFARLLLRPIWRSVRIQEAAKLADATSG
jgi:hypothetical protein